MTATQPLLDVRDLVVEFATRGGAVTAVRSVDLAVAKGETVGIVGESGSGKSVTSYALMRILDRAGRIANGSVSFSGVDLIAASERTMRDIRGREISMIFQNPRAALNPIRKVGHQIEDVLIEHALAGRAEARHKAIEMLKLVRINQPEQRYDSYPFELSGGMCQRIVIAIALACRPRLLIADEPTTGLDVTTQKAIMDLVVELTREREMSTILITHDLGLASAYCDKILVMEKGLVVENAKSESIFKSPEHAYTKRLMRATPRPGIQIRDLLPEEATSSLAPAFEPGPDRSTNGHDADNDESGARIALRASGTTEGDGSNAPPILQVKDLVKEFPMANGSAAGWFGLGRKKTQTEEKKPPVFRAVDGISFHVGAGECVGLVGESGCGKSTTSSMVMRLLDPTSGSIEFEDRDIAKVPAKSFPSDAARSRLQMVFQDPSDSLNPRFTAFRSIADPLYRLAGMSKAGEVRAKVDQLADRVGLPRELLDRFPHQLSGGQKARVGIARAIALDPRLLILDEPTAALDVSVQAVVLNLLVDLKRDLGMSYLFVSHDLQVVRLLCDRIIVMKSGRIIEEGPTEAVMDAPVQNYTRELIAAAPHPPV
jgi:peptide/nickel transport system ATP-binding protein